MYIKKIELINVKSIERLTMDFREQLSGWHVLLGKNGSGKSTIIKAISLSLLGERQAYALKENFKNWITKGKTESSITITLSLEQGKDSLASLYNGEIIFHLKIDLNGDLTFEFTANGLKERRLLAKPKVGWYSASFGAYRRLGKMESNTLAEISDGNLENHITLFDSDYNLSNATNWLKDLRFQDLESKNNSSIYNQIIEFINKSNLLPDEVYLEQVSHDGVKFRDGEYRDLQITQLSDGYQSIFILALEILRQLSKSFRFQDIIEPYNNKLIISASGVVLIDEIDVHLHPQWQAKIGNWFKDNFPKIQFIVTTHSPLICQSAEGASIWRIEHAKSDKQSEEIIGQDYKRMVYGNVLDAFSTDNFGKETSVRSETSKGYLKRLAELNIKSLQGSATEAELQEIKDIRAILPTSKS